LNVIKEERKSLVEKIVLKLHNAIQTVIICRRKHINKTRHQKELYNYFVLGKKPSEYVQDLIIKRLAHGQRPPAQPPPIDDVVEDEDRLQDELNDVVDRMDLDAVDAGVDPVEAVERNPDYDSDADWSLELEPMEGVDSGDELECVNTL
jgi:hypothetical protein